MSKIWYWTTMALVVFSSFMWGWSLHAESLMDDCDHAGQMTLKGKFVYACSEVKK